MSNEYEYFAEGTGVFFHANKYSEANGGMSKWVNLRLVINRIAIYAFIFIIISNYISFCNRNKKSVAPA